MAAGVLSRTKPPPEQALPPNSPQSVASKATNGSSKTADKNHAAAALLARHPSTYIKGCPSLAGGSQQQQTPLHSDKAWTEVNGQATSVSAAPLTQSPDSLTSVIQQPSLNKLSAHAFEAPPSPPESEAEGFPFPSSIAQHNQRVDHLIHDSNSDSVEVHVEASSPGQPPSPEVTRTTGLLSPPLQTPQQQNSQVTSRIRQHTSDSTSSQRAPSPPTPSARSLKRSATATETILTQSPTQQQQQQQQTEPTLLRAPSKLPDDRPLVGNLIGEDHVNYVLMYNMLTGIRIGVRLSYHQNYDSD